MELRKRARHNTIAPTVFADDARRARENPPGILQEEDARRLALTWQEVLQEVVQLVASERFGRVIQTYEWVSLSLDPQQPWGTSIHQVYVFRAAASVWMALSSCRGFSGRENPSFWKRVFGKLRECRSIYDERGDVKEDTHDNPVIDAIRFSKLTAKTSFLV